MEIISKPHTQPFCKFGLASLADLPGKPPKLDIIAELHIS